MDPLTLNILLLVGGFLISHLNLLPFIPKPSPKPAPFPTSVGHGELLKFIEQAVVNYLATHPVTPVSPNSGSPALDVTKLLEQLLALIEKQSVQVTAPVK